MPDRARSLVEAYVYLDLTTLDDPGDLGDLGAPSGPGGPGDPTLTEEQDAWRLRRGEVEVVVPYASEHEARREDLTFGSGLSTLIDAGQWVLISATYADRALEGALMYAADSSDPSSAERFDGIATDWRFAADATAEALKLLPTSDTHPTLDPPEEPPAEAFWTDMGRTAYYENPERFTQTALEDDLAYYRQSLIDFQRLHAR